MVCLNSSHRFAAGPARPGATRGLVGWGIALLGLAAWLPVQAAVLGWGSNAQGQLDVPGDLSDAVGVSAGFWHSLAWTRAGTVRGWGRTPNRANLDPLRQWTSIVAVASGTDQVLGLRTDGTLLIWGDTGLPAGLSRRLTNIVAIAAHANRYLALTGKGEILGWGTETPPQNLPALVAIAMNQDQNVGLTADGRIVAWGGGQTLPPPADLGDIAAAWAGPLVGVARGRNGTLVTWGPLFLPLDGIGLPMDLALGWGYWLAMQANGDAIGRGAPFSTSGSPVATPVAQGVVAVASGNEHVLALVGEGAPWFGPTVAERMVAAGASVSLFSPAMGALPLSYQWRRNGEDLAGATNAQLDLLEIQSSDAGAYTVVARNSSGEATRNYEVQVHPFLIERHPVSQQVLPGGKLELSVGVRGRELAFQWRFNGTELPGETRSTLVLESAGPQQAGTYQVEISHPALRASSREATISVPILASWDGNGASIQGVPSSQPDIVAVASQLSHGAALSRSGAVHVWGVVNDGAPTTKPPKYDDVVAVAPGYSHHLVLRADGTLTGWGFGDFQAFSFPPGLSRVVAISTLADSLALTDEGQVHSWGISESVPLGPPPSDARQIVAVSSGYQFALALTSDGRVLVWGTTTHGEDQVPAGLGPFVGIAASTFYCLGLTADGRVVRWGQEFSDPVPTGLDRVITLRAAYLGGVAVRDDGRAVVWGTLPPWVKPKVASLRNVADLTLIEGGVVALARHGPPWFPPAVTRRLILEGDDAFFHSPAMGAADLTYRWQRNGMELTGETAPLLALRHARRDQSGTYTLVASNALGTATRTYQVTVSPFSRTPSTSSVRGWTGGEATLGTDVVGAALRYQWRREGTELPGETNAALRLTNLTIAARGAYSVVIRNEFGAEMEQGFELHVDPVVAWGRNEHHQLEFPGSADAVVAVAAGDRHALALTRSGAVVGWGANDHGQSSIPEGLHEVKALAGGGHHSLALRADGTVVGWGEGNSGQLNIPPALTNAVAIAAGANHSLALTADGRVSCWGWSVFGLTNVPAAVTNATAIAAGAYHNLALLDSGRVVAWGSNASRQTNTPAAATNVVAIAAGGFHNLALRADGTVVGWGATNFAQSRVPADLTGIVAIAAGGDHSLARGADGQLRVWGGGLFGQTQLPPNLRSPLQVAAGGNFSLALMDRATAAAPAPVALGETTKRPVAEPMKKVMADLVLSPMPLVVPPAPIELAAGSGGTIACAAHPWIRYSLYLPPAYSVEGRALPILFTFNPNGGGMMNDFRAVAGQLQVVVVGVHEAKNYVEFPSYVDAVAAVTRDVRRRVRYDPTAVYAAGFSGGAWVSYDFAKYYRPFVAGVFALGGWLGNQYGPTDRFLAGLHVVRAAGASDPANNGRPGNPIYLRGYGAVVRDWRYVGAHEMPTDPVKRECLAWLIDQRTPAGPEDERTARAQSEAWRTALAEGRGETVFRECWAAIMDHPRTWEAHVAQLVLDDLMASFEYFRRLNLQGFAAGADATDYFYFRAIGEGKLSQRSGDSSTYHSALRALAQLTGLDYHRRDNVLEVMGRYGLPLRIDAFKGPPGPGVVSAQSDAPLLEFGLSAAGSLAPADWRPADGAPSLRDGRATWELPAAEAPQRYFRLEGALPPVIGLPRNATGTVFP